MDRITNRGAARSVLASVLPLLFMACSPVAPDSSPQTSGITSPAVTTESRPAARSVTKATNLEKTSLRLGEPVPGSHQLPIYIAAERTFREAGLNVEVISLGGAAGVAQALAADSIDVGLVSISGVVGMISAGQPVVGFYGRANVADIEWFARPEVGNWAGLKGKTIAVTSHGSTAEAITGRALRKHGLELGRDVQSVPTGGSANALQALRAGRIDAATLLHPFTWQAEEEGFLRLGTQAGEVADEWPGSLFTAKRTFLDEHPQTIRALLRAYVTAMRLVASDSESAVQTLMRTVKLERSNAERAYEVSRASVNERGVLPTEWLPVFWEVTIAAGEVAEPWPEERYLDRRFIDSFDEWATK